jgi:hypothetical protein
VTKKAQFMIAVGASVVIVRDGKRQTIQPGGGAEFTEEEVATITRTAPGALRKPVNERFTAPAEDADDDDDSDDGDGEKKAAPKAKAKAAPKPKAEAKADAEKDDADEDEDI